MRNPRNRLKEGWPAHRCGQCRLFRTDCLCAELPRLATRTRVVVVLHEKEDHKTTNTGRLATRCLPNSEVIVRGGLTPWIPPPAGSAESPWTAHGDPVLLFPHSDARPLSDWADHPRPITLIVPDGTWRQAKRVRRRVEGLQAVPCASISREAPSAYHLRHTLDPRRLSTLEAIAESLLVLEGADGPDVRSALLRIFQVMVERSLRTRYPGQPLRHGTAPSIEELPRGSEREPSAPRPK